MGLQSQPHWYLFCSRCMHGERDGNCINALLCAQRHDLRGAVSEVPVGSTRFLGDVAYPRVVEVHTGAVLVVAGGELPTVKLIGGAVDEDIVYAHGVAREQVLAVGDTQRRERHALCGAAAREIQTDCVGSLAGDEGVGLLDTLGLVVGVVLVAHTV